MTRGFKQIEGSKKSRGRVLTVLIIVFGAFAVVLAVGVKAFVVERVVVKGNEIYSDEQIEDWVMDDDYSWNSLYVILKSKFSRQDDIPFVDTMEVSLKSPTEVVISVTEKGVLGYTYVPSQEQYAYFDQDGFVVEISSETVPDEMRIAGLDVEDAQLYEKLEIDGSTLKNLLTLTQLLQKYDRVPEVIYLDDGDITLSYGDLQVDLGESTALTEKIMRMDEILTIVSGKKGTVHLDTWNSNEGNIYFKPGEMEEIPEY